MIVYIVEESTWDHHENVAVFASRQAAEDFCNDNYEEIEKGVKYYQHPMSYFIEEYEVHE